MYNFPGEEAIPGLPMSGELLFLCTCGLLIHSFPHLPIHNIHWVPLCARQYVGPEDTR